MMAPLIGRHSRPSPTTFSARSYGAVCPVCVNLFTFELGSLLDDGISPEDVEAVVVSCAHCGAMVKVWPADTWELIS